jgi:hypothetical protein
MSEEMAKYEGSEIGLARDPETDLREAKRAA